MNIHTSGAGQFVEYYLTRERNETKNEDDVNCGNTILNEDMIVAVVRPPKTHDGRKRMRYFSALKDFCAFMAVRRVFFCLFCFSL